MTTTTFNTVPTFFPEFVFKGLCSERSELECPLFAHQLGIFIDATFSDRQEPEVLIQSEADPDTTGSVVAKQIHGIVGPTGPTAERVTAMCYLIILPKTLHEQ